MVILNWMISDEACVVQACLTAYKIALTSILRAVSFLSHDYKLALHVS